ncbi:GNAT family N-acetyltransferase [Marinoscillum sp.]|uniref:GNAT family N-acetyltransferase n=1 Tax=Marinoscillum sp. TaxID=2024838 RepID=UPI003BAB9419
MITLRPAIREDISLLEYWDKQPHVRLSDGEEEFWDWQEELGVEVAWREQLVAELDGKPIGFVQIIDPYLEETHYWGEIEPNHRAIDIWIGEADYLNKGHGTQMMQQAITKCFAPDNVQAIMIDPLKSNRAAHRFYKRFGFKFHEERCFGKDECYVFRLTRTDWNSHSNNASIS